MVERSDTVYQYNGRFVYDGATWCSATTVEILNSIKTLPLSEDDILIMGYAKSGTSWLREIVWQIMHDGRQSEEVETEPLEFNSHGELTGDAIDSTSQNILKSHLRYHVFEKQITQGKVKAIVIMRNIKDCLVSYYHHHRFSQMLGNFKGTWNEFFDIFKAKALLTGDWLDFNLSWWRQRHRPNIYIIQYEELKKDPTAEIKNMTKFLNKDLSDEIISNIVRNTAFQVMKHNMTITESDMSGDMDCFRRYFMRKGEVGDWKTYFNPNQSEYIEKNYNSKTKEAGLVLKDAI